MNWLAIALGVVIYIFAMWLLARVCKGATLIEQADARGRELNRDIKTGEQLTKYRKG